MCTIICLCSTPPADSCAACPLSLRNFLGSGAGENMSQPVYLNRTMPKECRGPAAAAAELDDSIIVRNGLECKINCSNSKVGAVLCAHVPGVCRASSCWWQACGTATKCWHMHSCSLKCEVR